jgi:hypothetical protein
MFSFKSFFVVAIVIFVTIFSMCSNQHKPSTTMSGTAPVLWVPVNEDDATIYRDVPNYHFALAKEYLGKGEYSKASSELKRANAFLIYQNYRLSTAAKQIKLLSDSINAGNVKDVKKLEAVTDNAIKIIDNKYMMVPVVVNANADFEIDTTYTMAPEAVKPDSVFEEEFNYHFDWAKSNLQKNDQAGAASEIRKAASFLRLKAAYMGPIVQANLDSAGNELKELSSKVESGAVRDVTELDRVFQKAKHAASKQKE